MTNLSDAKRLKILQAADNWRKWKTLDDERLCIECAKLIAGREVLITDEGDGKMSLHCPTPDCNASSRDLFYHGTRDRRTPSRESVSQTGCQIRRRPRPLALRIGLVDL